MAIAVLLVTSIAVTGLTAWTILASKPHGLMAPLADQLVTASVLSAQAAAVLYAPPDKRGALVPKQPTAHQ